MGRYAHNVVMLGDFASRQTLTNKTLGNWVEVARSEVDTWEELTDAKLSTSFRRADPTPNDIPAHIPGAMFDMEYEGGTIPITKGLRLRCQRNAASPIDREKIVRIFAITDEEVCAREESGYGDCIWTIENFLNTYTLLEIMPYENPNLVIEYTPHLTWWEKIKQFFGDILTILNIR